MADLKKVAEMLDDPDAHLVKVGQKAVKDGLKVARRDVLADDEGKLVQRVGERPAHPPLQPATGQR